MHHVLYIISTKVLVLGTESWYQKHKERSSYSLVSKEVLYQRVDIFMLKPIVICFRNGRQKVVFLLLF